MLNSARSAVVVCLLAAAAVSLQAQVKIDSAILGAIEARPIGPAITSGRITAMDGVNSDPKTLYVGAAGGGVWKTTNGGVSFKPIFDKYTQAIGAIAVDQSKPETVWVGTGEVWVRNSVSNGTGLYRTRDGGDNWQFMGLAKSERIGRIVIDPKNSDTVYVAVLGALYNASEHRGLYKTTDGGKTWNKVLYVYPDSGCADIAIDPQEPSIVYASLWQFRRTPYSFSSGGPGSGLYRSADGGKTWDKLKNGLPEGELGRIAIAVAPSRPNRVYAVVETAKTGLYRSDDAGASWKLMSTNPSLGARPFYFALLVCDPKDYNRLYKPGFVTSVSRDGGATFVDIAGATHSDHHALWIDPATPSTMYLGTDGGVYRSADYGVGWNFLRGLPVSQFYHVAYDMERPYNVYGGLQDNGSWAAPSQGRDGVANKDWLNVGFGDGFYVWPHLADKDIIYSQWQGGKVLRFHKTTGEMKAVSPFARKGEPKYRFNWNAGTAMSATNPDTLYVGAQFLFRSRDKGESWERISPDLTTNDPARQKQEESGGLTIDNSSAENNCTIYAIAESPLDAKVIWVGTDDGNLQVTRDGGKTWKNVAAAVPGLPHGTWVSGVEASRFAPGRAFATFDGHMTGDIKPYIYRTEDFGQTWTPLATDAVTGFAHVIREDPEKADLLFAGTEFGLYVSIDGGRQWARFTGNFPEMVPVRDIKIHPREHDLIVATHGRGIYIVDNITAFRKITPELLESKLTVIETGPSPVRFSSFEQDFSGTDEFRGRNPSDAAYITYYMKERHMFGDFKIEVFDSNNQLITTLAPGKRRGINRVPWAMRLKPPKVPASPGIEGGVLVGPMLPEGTYTAKLTKGTDVYTAKIDLVGDPRLPHSAEDRKLQQTTAMKLYQLIERLAFVAAQTQDVRDKARERAGKLPRNDDLARTLAGFADKLDAFNKTLVSTREGTGIYGEDRLREQIAEVYGEVTRFGGRPTRSQMDRAVTLEADVDKAGKDLDAMLAALDGLSTRLKDKKLDPIARLTKEEYARRQ
jgi:photosystem II stability/assembly factor-like uncharacterized protein